MISVIFLWTIVLKELGLELEIFFYKLKIVDKVL